MIVKAAATMRAMVCGTALAMALLAPAALAQTKDKENLSKTVLNGQRIRIDGYYHINPDCSLVGYPVIRVTSKPVAGDVEIKKEQSFPSFDKDNPRAQCNNRRVPAVAVYYRAKAGFIGDDAFSMELFWTDGDVWRRNVRIDVR